MIQLLLVRYSKPGFGRSDPREIPGALQPLMSEAKSVGDVGPIRWGGEAGPSHQAFLCDVPARDVLLHRQVVEAANIGALLPCDGEAAIAGTLESVGLKFYKD